MQKETESHAETQAKVAMLNQKLKEMKDELDSNRKQNQELVKIFKSLDIESSESAEKLNHSCTSSESDVSPYVKFYLQKAAVDM